MGLSKIKPIKLNNQYVHYEPDMNIYLSPEIDDNCLYYGRPGFHKKIGFKKNGIFTELEEKDLDNNYVYKKIALFMAENLT